jgi:hypothetical protein
VQRQQQPGVPRQEWCKQQDRLLCGKQAHKDLQQQLHHRRQQLRPCEHVSGRQAPPLLLLKVVRRVEKGSKCSLWP